MRARWLVVPLLIGAEALAGTYGHYSEAFPGFVISIPIMVGSMSPESAEIDADRGLRALAAMRAKASLTLIKRMREHWKTHFGRFARTHALLDDAVPTDADSDRFAYVPLEPGLGLSLLLSQGTEAVDRDAVAIEFALEQFLDGGPGLDPLPEPSPLAPYPVGMPSTNLCWSSASGVYPILRALTAKEQTPPPDADSDCAKATVLLFRSALAGKAPPIALVETIVKLPVETQGAFLTLAVQLTPEKDRHIFASEWVPKLRANVEKQAVDDNRYFTIEGVFLQFCALVKAPSGELSGTNRLENLRKRAVSVEEMEESLRFIRVSSLPVAETAAILTEILRRADPTSQLFYQAEELIRDFERPIPNLDPALLELVESKARPSELPWLGTLVAIVKTRSPAPDRGALILSVVKRIEHYPNDAITALGEVREPLPESQQIIEALAAIADQAFELDAIVALTEKTEWPLADPIRFYSAVLQRPYLTPATRGLVLSRLRMRPELPPALAKRLDDEAERNFVESMKREWSPGIWGPALGRSNLPEARKLELVEAALKESGSSEALTSLVGALGGRNGLVDAEARSLLEQILKNANADWHLFEALADELVAMDIDSLKQVPGLSSLLVRVARTPGISDRTLKQFLKLLERNTLSKDERRHLLEIIATSGAGEETTRDEAKRLLK